MMKNQEGARGLSRFWTRRSTPNLMFIILLDDKKWMPTSHIFATYLPNFHPLRQKRSHPYSIITYIISFATLTMTAQKALPYARFQIRRLWMDSYTRTQQSRLINWR